MVMEIWNWSETQKKISQLAWPGLASPLHLNSLITRNSIAPALFLKHFEPTSSSPSSNLAYSFSGKRKIVWEKYRMRSFSRRGCGPSGDGFIAAAAASGCEKEAFTDDGSSGIPSAHVAGWLEVTMNRLSKWLVTAIFGALLILRHDAEVVWFAMGSVLNVLLSLTLKQTLKQERPSALRPGHGMPSSHAQSIFFAAVALNVSMVESLGLNAATTILGGLVLAFGSYFSWLRVSLHYHTMSQVSVGAMVGSFFSIFWFWVWNAFVSKAFISSLWLGIIVVLVTFGYVLGFLLLVLLHCLLNHKD